MDFFGEIFEIFLWVVVVVWVVRRIFGGKRSRAVKPPRAERQAPAPTKTLQRDPVCGTYVSEDISHRLEEGDKTLHFCSEECRMRYIARQRRSAQA